MWTCENTFFKPIVSKNCGHFFYVNSEKNFYFYLTILRIVLLGPLLYVTAIVNIIFKTDLVPNIFLSTTTRLFLIETTLFGSNVYNALDCPTDNKFCSHKCLYMSFLNLHKSTVHNAMKGKHDGYYSHPISNNIITRDKNYYYIKHRETNNVVCSSI